MDACTHDGHNAMTIARWPLASGAKKICFVYLIQKVFMKEMCCGSQSVCQREIPQTRSFKKIITILQTCSILTLFRRQKKFSQFLKVKAFCKRYFFQIPKYFLVQLLSSGSLKNWLVMDSKIKQEGHDGPVSLHWLIDT